MTKQMNQQLKSDKEYRNFANFEVRASSLGTDDQSQQEMYIEGYACVFDSPTVIWEYDGIEYKETIDNRAFDECDMSDVILNFDHAGKVFARTRNNTLTLMTDDKGLFIRARVDQTEAGRQLYEEVQGGFIDRMSFAFSVKEEAYDRENHTRILRKFKKLYDVSCVSIPAYQDTSVSARSFFESQIEMQNLAEVEEKQKAVAQEQRKKLLLMTYC